MQDLYRCFVRNAKLTNLVLHCARQTFCWLRLECCYLHSLSSVHELSDILT